MSIDIGAIAPVSPTAPADVSTGAPKPRRSLGTLPVSLATIAAIIAAWSLASAYGLVSPLFLPSPLVVVKAIYSVAVNGFVDSTLAEHTFASLLRIFAALAAALVIGIPAGLAIGTSRIGQGHSRSNR